MAEYHGTSGNDVIDQHQLGIADGSVIYGEGGDDTITSYGAHVIGGSGNDTLIAAGPAASVDYWTSPTGVTVDLSKGTASDGFGTTDRLVNFVNVQGSPFNDTFIGSAANEYFYGNGGSDTFIGGGGADTVSYYFQPSTAATITYDAATDTFTVVKHFSNGDQGTDKLTGISYIAFSGSGSDNAIFSRSSFSGDFRAEAHTSTFSLPPGTGGSGFRAADFNGDGKIDLLLDTTSGTGTTAAPTLIFAGDGAGLFTDQTATVFAAGSFTKGLGGGRVYTADLNGDGEPDALFVNQGNDAPPYAGGVSALVLSDSKTGKLVDASSQLPLGTAFGHAASIGDLNGDGFPDLLINTLDRGNILMLNDGAGHFHDASKLLPYIVAPQPISGPNGPISTNTYSGIVDLNGDGYNDIVLGRWDSPSSPSNSVVLLNPGNGDFSHVTPLNLPLAGVANEIIVDIKAIDLNGDSRPDLILSVTSGDKSSGAYYETPYIQFLRNDGNGKFTDVTSIALPQAISGHTGWYNTLTVVDFNHDGRPDILATGSGAPGAPSVVFINNGDGTFRQDQTFDGVSLAADVNNDGMSDIVTNSGQTILTSLNTLTNGHAYVANFGGGVLVGSAQADTMRGLDGDVSFTGGGGNDVITGGSGHNTANYSGNIRDYNLAVGSSGAWQVADLRSGSPDGTDTLSSIQTLQFADGDVVLPASSGGASVLSGLVVDAALTILRAQPFSAADASLVADLSAKVINGQLTTTAAIQAIITAAGSTASVATLAYEFFTGSTPGAGGMDYLVSPTGPNPNNLNAPYYQHFSLENRYINFAVNLGKVGAGAASFQANYGALSLSDAMTKAYTTTFGTTPTAAKIDTLLNGMVPDGLGGVETRAQYFAFYGQDGLTGLGTKAAMVGWLLGEAVKADVGDYALSNDAFLADIAAGTGKYGVDLIGHYDKASYHYTGG